MALEGVIFQHDHIYSYNGKEAYSTNYKEDEPPFYDLQASLRFLDNQTQNYDSSTLLQEEYGNTTTFFHQPPHEIVINEAKTTPNRHSSSTLNCDMSYHRDMGNQATRRRSRVKKNKEEINNQRMTHIAVERNRRKVMNEYLSVLRSIMPESYVQRVSLINFYIYNNNPIVHLRIFIVWQKNHIFPRSIFWVFNKFINHLKYNKFLHLKNKILSNSSKLRPSEATLL